MGETTRALLISFILHFLLAVVFLLVKYIPSPETEMLRLIEFGYEVISDNEKYYSPLNKYSQEALNSEGGFRTNLIPKRVNLPKTVIPTRERFILPQSEISSYNKIDLEDQFGVKDIGPESEKNVINKSTNQLAEKAILPGSADYLKNLEAKLNSDIEGKEPYLLEGDIVSRGIDFKILPQYPPNIQKIVDVKIKFDVLPGGKTANIMVVKKADPELEKVSVEAISQWKFSPINRDIIQKGYITFIFQLK